MTLPPGDASDRLREIAASEGHSLTAYRYQRFAPHLFLWGAIWMVGYGASFIAPPGPVLWPALVAIGMAGSFWMGRARTARDAGIEGWRYGGTALAVFLFIWALLAIFRPTSGLQVAALIPLMIALLYTVQGLWMRAARITLLGVALGALTVGGYFWLAPSFLLLMAGAGGGGLILGGFWLRSI